MKNKLRIPLVACMFALILAPVLFFVTASGTRAQIIPDPLTTATSNSNKLPQYNSGVDQSIQDYLCTPEGNGTDLFNCVNRLYRFGITAGTIALIFFIVLAGYIYITGGEAQKTKAKSIMFSALTGMGIVLCSFVLLNFINPNLVQIKTIQPPIFESADLPMCEEIGFSANCIISIGPSQGQVFNGGGRLGGKKCDPITDNSVPGSVDNLAKTCWGKYGADVVRKASIVARNETGGRPIDVYSGSCGAGRQPARCIGGEVPVYGVFQINLMAHSVGGLNCPAAFAPLPKGKSFCSVRCEVTNKNLYNQCYAAVKNLKTEFDTACGIYEKNIKSGLPPFNAWGNVPNAHAKKCGF
jgi:hypothetical protein